MEKITNTELAILGLVAEQPRYGYQVEQDIAARGMREWTEVGFSSIYYVLNKLEASGWLTSGEEETAMEGGKRGPSGENTAALEGAGQSRPGYSGSPAARRAGPARKVYHLTGAGWEGLRAAVRERLAGPRPRTGDFDLALANLPVLPPDEARAALETYHRILLERLAHVRAKWQQDRAAAAHSNQPFPQHVDALFDHSVKMLEAEVEWVGRNGNTLFGNAVIRQPGNSSIR